jgi:hypothetical protein
MEESITEMRVQSSEFSMVAAAVVIALPSEALKQQIES